jgi:hypothetical protein
LSDVARADRMHPSKLSGWVLSHSLDRYCPIPWATRSNHLTLTRSNNERSQQQASVPRTGPRPAGLMLTLHHLERSFMLS